MRDPSSLSAENASLTVHENLVILRTRRDRWRKKQQQPEGSREADDDTASQGTRSSRSTELVREDVYLMDNKHRRAHANLLANSLTARLRKNLPDDPKLQQSAMRKIRRDSLKDFVHLDNLNRQYTCEMNWESNRLDKESSQLLRRHSQLQRHSELQRRQQERLESSLRSRSGLSSASLLPRLVESEATFCDSPDKVEEFPEFAKVDKDDMSHVKFFKLKGVFQPQNKYSSRIEPFEISAKVKPKGNDLQDSLKMADIGSPVDLPPRSRMSKKNLRVSWSSQSRVYGNEDDDVDSILSPSRADTRASRPDTRLDADSPDRDENRITPSTVKSFRSFRSDSYLKRRHLKPQEKLETVGVHWKVPRNNSIAVKEDRGRPTAPSPSKMAPSPVKPASPTKLAATGEVSRVLIPVTAALDKEGLTPNKMRWHVQKAQSVSTLQMYQSWLEKMELLKSSSPATSSIPTPVQKLPNRTYLSVMATRV